ncbi:MAG: hypothetical protein GVY20_11920 [Bacteroidetes bacterium]|jgi:putative restriction endonuclease|nr:hypothetical protein [Bacteroidota bacterium]
MENYSDDIKLLLNINADRSHNWDDSTRGQAPHKPFLLLSIMDGIEQGWIPDNRIKLTQSLTETFFTYWNAVMGEDRITTIALPFFYMKSEPFWELIYKPDQKPYKNSPSLGGLKKRLDYAILDSRIFEIMNTPVLSEQLRQRISATYFSPEAQAKLSDIRTFNYQSYDYGKQLEAFAAEPFKIDHTSEEEIKYRTQRTQVRDAGFSKTVRSAYDYTCAVCRSKVITQGGSTLVDGAHIVPRSQRNNDDPRNGLALCKTHHWMYDQYLLTVTPSYKVQLSGWLKKEDNSVGDLWDYHGKEILYPSLDKYQPAAEALENHFLKYKEMQ